MALLTRLVVDVADAIAEIVSAELFEAGAGGLEEQRGPRGVRFIVYADDPQRLRVLQTHARRVFEDLDAEDACAEISEIEAPDWRREWMRHLEPEPLGARFVWQPASHEAPAPAGRRRLCFEPRMAFGVGSHASTRLAAAAVEAYCERHPSCTVLDVGCGTGVLTIVAVASGARSALGIDIDPVAVDAARHNARLNDLHDACRFERGPLDRLDERFDLVIGNLELPVLSELAEQLHQRCRRGGRLVVTGFLSAHAGEIRRRFEDYGRRCVNEGSDDGYALLELDG